MTHDLRFIRRNRVREGPVTVVAALGGVVAVLARAEPTGGPIDVALVAGAIGAVVWAAASAPWWALGATAGAAAVASVDPIGIASGGVAFIAALVIGARRQHDSIARSGTAALSLNVLIRSDLHEPLGASALVGVLCGLLLLVSGLRRRRSLVRRRGWMAMGGLGGAVVLALLATVAATLGARAPLVEGQRLTRSGIEMLESGEFGAAADRFERAAAQFARARDSLAGPLALPGQAVPVVAQNVRAGSDLADAGEQGLEAAARALTDIDLDRLRIVDGAIDLDAVRGVAEPLRSVDEAIADVQAVLGASRSPWLVEPVRERIDALASDVAERRPQLATAIGAAEAAPALLGGSGERRYLVLFTSPAEARGLGGFIGNYAELHIDDGRITVDRFGRRSELERAIATSGADCGACPTDFIRRYGRFGFTTGPRGGVAPRAWSNLTMSAHFPDVARTAAALYPQSGGRPVDGVLVMDPYVIEEFMAYTGAVEIPQLDVTVDPSDAAEFILSDQYVLAGERHSERIDALGTLGGEVVSRLLAASLPAPVDLVRDLGPLVDQRRLLMWSDDPSEQAFLDDVGLSGSLPPLSESGGFSVAVTNATGNKIDVFLERRVDVRVSEGDGGRRTLVADVRLTNEAPSTRLPEYVIGNSIGLPTGTSRLFVTFYGPPGLVDARQDGASLSLEPLAEAGWVAYSTFLELDSGETADFSLEFDLDSSEGTCRGQCDVARFDQPLVRVD